MLADEAEMLQRLWFPVARLQDLNAGRPLAGRLLGERVVVYRAAADVTVAIDRCPHRGAQLSLGHLRGETLECAYHGWRWDHAGACSLVPSQPEVHSNATLHTLPSCEGFGLVWACLGSPAADPPSIPEVDEDGDGGWEVAHGEWFDVRCGLRTITENFRDSSHFAFVHRETFGDVNPAIGAYTVRAEGRRLAWELELTFGSEWSARDDHGDRLPPKYRFGAVSSNGAGADAPSTMLLKYRFELPSLSYVYTEHEGGGRRLVCQAAAPTDLESRSSRVFFFVAANEAFRRHNGPLATQIEIETRVFAEDVPIVESLDPTEAPLELDGQAHVRADRYSVAYRKLYREMLNEFRSSRERETAHASAE